MTDSIPPARATEPISVPNRPRPDIHVVRIGSQLLVGPGHYAGEQSCVARTTRGRRCGNPVEHSQAGYWVPVVIPGWGEVSAMDIGDDDGDDLPRRWLDQRCALHWGSDRPDATAPEWVAFDPSIHAVLRREKPWSGKHGEMTGDRWSAGTSVDAVYRQ